MSIVIDSVCTYKQEEHSFTLSGTGGELYNCCSQHVRTHQIHWPDVKQWFWGTLGMPF